MDESGHTEWNKPDTENFTYMWNLSKNQIYKDRVKKKNPVVIREGVKDRDKTGKCRSEDIP
jgi:hypothetical protein